MNENTTISFFKIKKKKIQVLFERFVFNVVENITVSILSIMNINLFEMRFEILYQIKSYAIINIIIKILSF